ncbi:MAG TPA: TerB family tellurite resistance protein [Chryseolinea sp.]|nr:TerB family tellurite resistance protein [Chryseolinea sp.]HPM29024.1 TerB family tellurite resistance protein [Chryseolinea sp.]
MNKNYQLGLLYLVHLLVSADGVVDEKEMGALQKIREKEKVSDDTFREFELTVQQKKERDIYQTGIEMLNQCTDQEKTNAFVIMYKMSEVDGRVHVKEVRLLLYSIKMTGIEFDDVVNVAKATPSFF